MALRGKTLVPCLFEILTVKASPESNGLGTLVLMLIVSLEIGPLPDEAKLLFLTAESTGVTHTSKKLSVRAE